MYNCVQNYMVESLRQNGGTGLVLVLSTQNLVLFLGAQQHHLHKVVGTLKNQEIVPWLGGSICRSIIPYTKVCRFESQSGHIPRLQVWLLVRTCMRYGRQPIDVLSHTPVCGSVCLPLPLPVFLSVPSSLSKNQWKHILGRGLKK